jgi:hypothetical protein
MAGEIWVPGNLALPNEGKEILVSYIHASLSKHHMGLLTIISQGNQVFRRYVHNECDLVFREPLRLLPGSQIWMGSGPTHVEPETLSCTFTVIGRTV